MARRLRRPCGRLHRPLPPGGRARPSPIRPRRCSSIRPPCRTRFASSWPSGSRSSAPSRSAGSSSATRARRPTRTRSRWRGSTPAGQPASRWRADGMAERSPCLAVTDGASTRRRPVAPACRSRARSRSTMSPRLERPWTTRSRRVILEPVQGMPGRAGLLSGIPRGGARACTRAGAALIFDEIQCGVGPLGRLHRRRVLRRHADILTLAKGLASGLPIGAMVVDPCRPTDLTHRRSRQHLRRRAGRLRRGAGDPRRHRAGGADGQRHRDRRLPIRAGALAIGVYRVQGRGLLLGLRLAAGRRGTDRRFLRTGS